MPELMDEQVSRPAIIATLTGFPLDYLDPDPGSLVLEDLAEGMAKCCRFGGQCRGWYSVARHSVIGSYYAEDPIQFLFHDSAEGYMGDVATPLKQLVPEWKPIENRLLRKIMDKFGVAYIPGPPESDPLSENTHRVDRWMYTQEWHAMMRRDRITWHYPGHPNMNVVRDISAQLNYDWIADFKLWMDRYRELTASPA